ncbi:MAG: hypothetical protein QXW34_00380 [Candidatus Methanomethyliaceae archaeon]
MSKITPSEVKIISGVEVFSGLVYLLFFFAFINSLYLLLSILSFIIAFGLWRLYKWAWYLCMIISLFGIVSSIVISVMYEFGFFSTTPKIIIDFMIVLMLMTKDVRKAFSIGR